MTRELVIHVTQRAAQLGRPGWCGCWRRWQRPVVLTARRHWKLGLPVRGAAGHRGEILHSMGGLRSPQNSFFLEF